MVGRLAAAYYLQIYGHAQCTINRPNREEHSVTGIGR
jgi:hypothetical protein